MDFSYKNFKVGTCAGQKEVDGETMPILSQPPEHNKSDREMCSTSGLAQPYVCKIRMHTTPCLLHAFQGMEDDTSKYLGVLARFVTATETEFSSTKGGFCYLGRK
ncbi:hypothetical protein NC652_019989 [Populus alba x Populus x berolinensis]|nr:hypothetical protein NC652_019989 [Populus alba x Populus x berolinensis]